MNHRHRRALIILMMWSIGSSAAPAIAQDECKREVSCLVLEQCKREALETDAAEKLVRSCQRDLDAESGKVAQTESILLESRKGHAAAAAALAMTRAELDARPKWSHVVIGAGAGAGVALVSFGAVRDDRSALIAGAGVALVTLGVWWVVSRASKK